METVEKFDMEEIITNINSVPKDDQHIVGLADLRGLLEAPYEKYRYALVIAKKLNDNVLDSIRNGPNLEYFSLYNDTNSYLSDLVIKISNELRAINVDSMAIKPTMSDQELSNDYQKTLRTNFSHKMAGTRAGIGWIGKTDLLVTKEFGPRVRLATVLTKTPIGKCGTPINKSRCGKCSECIDSCSAKAGNGLLWDVTVDRDQFYDPFKCREYCKKISKQNINKDISLCGICVSVCPVGRV
jgi:epoxyqueuosine reductase QueG